MLLSSVLSISVRASVYAILAWKIFQNEGGFPLSQLAIFRILCVMLRNTSC